MAQTSEPPEETVRRLKLAYIVVLTMMLVVVLMVGLVKLIATDQMPGSLVLLALGMAGTVAKLLPPWPAIGRVPCARRCSEEL